MEKYCSHLCFKRNRRHFAEALALKGIKTYDALHISCAVAAHCTYYLTTDKKLLNTPVHEIRIVDPVTFVNEMEESL